MNEKVYTALIESKDMKDEKMITLAINGLMLQSHKPITEAEADLLQVACKLLESKFEGEDL